MVYTRTIVYLWLTNTTRMTHLEGGSGCLPPLILRLGDRLRSAVDFRPRFAPGETPPVP